MPAPLPDYAKEFISSSSALSMRLPAEEVEIVAEEPEVLHRLGRQNLLLRIPFPHHDFVDLRLSSVQRRLTLSFCTRNSISSGVQRHSLRRDLGGAVDLRQSYADVVGSGESSELQVGI